MCCCIFMMSLKWKEINNNFSKVINYRIKCVYEKCAFWWYNQRVWVTDKMHTAWHILVLIMKNAKMLSFFDLSWKICTSVRCCWSGDGWKCQCSFFILVTVWLSVVITHVSARMMINEWDELHVKKGQRHWRSSF